LLMNVKPCLLP